MTSKLYPLPRSLSEHYDTPTARDEAMLRAYLNHERPNVFAPRHEKAFPVIHLHGDYFCLGSQHVRFILCEEFMRFYDCDDWPTMRAVFRALDNLHRAAECVSLAKLPSRATVRHSAYECWKSNHRHCFRNAYSLDGVRSWSTRRELYKEFNAR